MIIGTEKLSCNLHDKAFRLYVFHRSIPVGILTICPFVGMFYKGIHVGLNNCMPLLVGLGYCPKNLWYKFGYQHMHFVHFVQNASSLRYCAYSENLNVVAVVCQYGGCSLVWPLSVIWKTWSKWILHMCSTWWLVIYLFLISMQSHYLYSAIHRIVAFHRSRIQTLGHTDYLFMGPQLNFHAQLPVSGQVNLWPMSLPRP
jgi:hypothetical protein